LNAPSPSSGAILNAFINEQEKRPLWNGRPSTNRGIPIQLYHPTFAKFMRTTSDDTVDIKLDPEGYSAVHSLFHKSAVIYKDETARSNEIRVFLNRAIRHRLATLEAPGMRADGAYEVPCGNLYAVAALEEEKNEIGTGGKDPSHQCGLDYRLFYAHKRVCASIPHNASRSYLVH
jgi:hypothetical protein